MSLEATIGLEVHVQLATKTKLFCSCLNQFAAPPNSLTCPICSGLPGTLPFLNATALELGIRAALALECQIAEFTKFDRKNYFYPDLPKGYQISQFDLPLSKNGRVVLGDGTVIRIHRIHMEEDAGKGIHDRGDFSLMDFNRAGVPLLECVSEPDLHTPEQAVEYLTRLKEIFRGVGASECDMEKGSLRCDVNVSVAPKGAEKLGTKVEVKNLNSFRHVGKALEYEIARQSALVSNRERIFQETRLWREAEAVTHPMRSKEEAHDYRYFPEPDLPPITISKEKIETVRKTLPELPATRRERFQKQYALSLEEASLLNQDLTLAHYFEETAKLTGNPKSASNWITGVVLQALNEKQIGIESLSIKPDSLSDLIRRVDSGQINVASGRSVFFDMIATGKPAADLIREKGLEQISDEAALEKLALEAIAAIPKAVEQFKAGKEKALDSLVGKVMGATKGRANPKIVQDILRRLISSS